jgi:hypothetical protein
MMPMASPMPAARDPLSVRYDRTARHILLTAIRAHQHNPDAPRAAKVWVHSPGHEYRHLDRGGRTASERALTRALYYQTWRQPINAGVPPTWSLKLEWGRVERRGSRYGRHLRVRLFLARSGARHAASTGERKQWRANEALRSTPGNRIDS